MLLPQINAWSQVSFYGAIATLVAAYIAYGIGLLVYRLYFSPLSKYPGPKLAAATLWYEFYFDVIKRGRFAWEIKRMHEVYGPVIRINPHEIHVNEPDFYDELYTGSARKRNKYAWSTAMFITPGAMLTTVEHDLHRRRRAPLAPYFSMQAIRIFDPVIRDKLEKLSSRFNEYRETGQPVDLDQAFSAMTTDVITEYSFGISNDFLEAESFNPEWTPLLKSLSEQSLLTKQMPRLMKTMSKIPLSWLVIVKPTIANYVRFRSSVEMRLNEVMSGAIKPSEDAKHPTVFHGMLDSGLPPEELAKERLFGEGETLVAAGTLTTAHFLKCTVYHLLANPTMWRRLSDELEQVMPDPRKLPPFSDLIQPPYFNAVINEGFRLSHGVISRLTRIAPDEDLEVAGYVLPAGTPISMSSWLLHLNPDLFPSPNDFRPERWFEPGADRLKKYLVNFSKGSRNCLGKDLAKTEIVYTLALVVRRWGGKDSKGMELFETTRADADVEHDFFTTFPSFKSKGIRVLFN